MYHIIFHFTSAYTQQRLEFNPNYFYSNFYDFAYSQKQLRVFVRVLLLKTVSL